MSLIQTHPNATVALPASEWARLLSQGPTDVQTMPGALLLVYPDSWTPAQVANAIHGAGPSVPPGVPPSG